MVHILEEWIDEYLLSNLHRMCLASLYLIWLDCNLSELGEEILSDRIQMLLDYEKVVFYSLQHALQFAELYSIEVLRLLNHGFEVLECLPYRERYLGKLVK